jgi:uncharacterized protein YecT (DUF1311 family)
MDRVIGSFIAAIGAALIAFAGLAVNGGAQAQTVQQHQRAEAVFPLWHQGNYSTFALTDSGREVRLSPDYRRCIADAAGVKAAKRACAAQEMEALDSVMKAAFKTAVERRSNPAARADLRADQQSWEQQRRAACTEAAGPCAVHETVRRTVWLEFA